MSSNSRWPQQIKFIVGNEVNATRFWSPQHTGDNADAGPASYYAVLAACRMADVLLVTSLHDGMNLVAKEFISARTDGDGVLLLSQYTGVARELTPRDREIAETLAPQLFSQGLLLVGLDVIGNFLTEVNVTSPTCFQEITEQTGFHVAGMMIDALERAAESRRGAGFTVE